MTNQYPTLESERERLREIMEQIQSGKLVVKQGEGDVIAHLQGRIAAIEEESRRPTA